MKKQKNKYAEKSREENILKNQGHMVLKRNRKITMKLLEINQHINITHLCHLNNKVHIDKKLPHRPHKSYKPLFLLNDNILHTQILHYNKS